MERGAVMTLSLPHGPFPLSPQLLMKQTGPYLQHACVDDAHVHARGHGVVEEDRVDGLTDHVHAAEPEAQVRHAAADARIRALLGEGGEGGGKG